MKKIIGMILCCIFCLMLFFSSGVTQHTAEALVLNEGFLMEEIRQELTTFLEKDSEQATRNDRTAGSNGEFLTAQYIYSRLNAIGLEKTNAYGFNSGAMNVEYVNFNGECCSTYNISYTLKSNNADAKTVVLLTHYDNMPITSVQGNIETTNYETVNQSSGTVAMLLAMAQYLKNAGLTFDVNIEFVFVGSDSENNAGARQFEILRANYASEIALIILFDRVTVGDYNYFYSGEAQSQYSLFISNQMNGKNGFSKFNAISSTYYPETDYVYYSAGKTKDFDLFYGAGFNTTRIFSGNYEGIGSVGYNESKSHPPITGTTLDTIEGIERIYNNSVSFNLSKVAKGTIELLASEDFNSRVVPNEQANQKLNFFHNYTYVLLLCGLTIAVFIVVFGIVGLHYEKIAILHASKNGIDDAVMNISVKLGVGDNPEIKSKIKEKIQEKQNKKPKD